MATDELADAADAVRQQEQDLDDARAYLAQLAQAELERGVTKTAIQRRTGFSTNTVRKWIDRHAQDSSRS